VISGHLEAHPLANRPHRTINTNPQAPFRDPGIRTANTRLQAHSHSRAHRSLFAARRQ